MKVYIENGYIRCFGNGEGGKEISEEEYAALLDAIKNKPSPTETNDYRLLEDLTWEAYQIEPQPDPEIDDSEALSIMLGEETE